MYVIKINSKVSMSAIVSQIRLNNTPYHRNLLQILCNIYSLPAVLWRSLNVLIPIWFIHHKSLDFILCVTWVWISAVTFLHMFDGLSLFGFSRNSSSGDVIMRFLKGVGKTFPLTISNLVNNGVLTCASPM